MKRLFGFSLLTLAMLALPSFGASPQASAQATSIPQNQLTQGLEVRIGDKTLQVAGSDRDRDMNIGLDQCSATTEFAFTSRFSVAVGAVEIWVSQNLTTDCNDKANRARTGTQPDTNCWPAKVFSERVQPNTDTTFTVPAVNLFVREKTATECPDVSAQQYAVYVVPLPSVGEETNAPDPVPNAEQRKAIFTLYIRPPAAPTGVKGESGDRAMSVSWGASSGADPTTQYRVFYDTAQDGTGDVECGSGALVAGKEPPAIEGSIRSKTVTNNTKASITELGDVEYGQEVAVAVATVDIAGNVSPLSNVVCIERVDVDTFLDTVDDGSLETCALRPGAARGSAVWSLGLLGLALMLRRRRSL